MSSPPPPHRSRRPLRVTSWVTVGVLVASALVVALVRWTTLRRFELARRFHSPSRASALLATGSSRPRGLRSTPARRDAGSRRQRRDRAEWTLASYVDWARYPPSSRPIAERPDLGAPDHVPPRALPLVARDDDDDRDRVYLLLTQDRHFVVGEDAVALTIRCRRRASPAPCAVDSASLDAAPDLPREGGPRAVAFVREDASTWSARVAPSSDGFAGYHGPLHVDADVRAGSERGRATFELEVTPSAPAHWTGQARDELRDGSLDVCATLEVEVAGRYRFAARFADDSGEAIAHATARVEAPTGALAVCFTLFGKLVVDAGARGPFTLRDVEGFLQLDDAFPDRRTVPTWSGALLRTRAYEADDFSDADWQSAEKTRTRAALEANVDRGE